MRLLLIAIATLFGSVCFAQTFSGDTCVSMSKSKMLNLGMDQLYTDVNGPVKSILVKNKKWILDSTGNIIEELNLNFKNIETIDRRKVVKYYQSGQIKSISLYEKSGSESKTPTVLTSQELYNWSNETRTLIQLKGLDTVRLVLEKIDKNGCVELRKEQQGENISETQYEYQSSSLQSVKTFKRWDDGTLKESFETRLLYDNDILYSKTTIHLITKDTTCIKYHLDDNELKGYLIDPSNPSDSTHIISRNSIGKIIFRHLDKMTFYVIDSTQNGIRYQDKIYFYNDRKRKVVDKYVFSSNGDVSITITENGEQQSRTTKKQTKDDYGNWIKLVIVRKQLNKPDRENIIQRKIEYLKQ